MTLILERFGGAGQLATVPTRITTPSQDREIARLLESGLPAPEIARLYGIGLRTVYRAKERARRRAIVVVVAGYKAWFEISDLGPVQVTGWVAA